MDFAKDAVILEDQTLRDGLQNVSRIIPLPDKIGLFELLVESGIKKIQVGSFVSPRMAPQMSDTDELVRLIHPPADVVVTALALNERGLERAVAGGLRHVSLSVSVSDAHSRKNVNRSADRALIEICGLIETARRSGLTVKGGVQCAFGCRDEGVMAPETVITTAERLVRAGAEEINLADTAGMATPQSVGDLVRRARLELPETGLSLHLHGDHGQALDNLLAGYDEGARLFDVCVGGPGGCIVNQRTLSNVSTEEAAAALDARGAPTGVDREKLKKAAELLASLLSRE